MKKGFTLAEVLITLAIIGVVAALTIPSVIVKTQQQEFKTAAKKAHSVLSQAVQLTEVKDGYSFSDGELFVQALMNNMNITKVEKAPGSTGGYALPSVSPMLPYPGAAMALGTPGGSVVKPPDLSDIENPSLSQASYAVFYTADGMRYHVNNVYDTDALFIVDVNGDKGPTRFDTTVQDVESSVAVCTKSGCDPDDPNWTDIRLSDLFQIYFYNNGSSVIIPYGFW